MRLPAWASGQLHRHIISSLVVSSRFAFAATTCYAAAAGRHALTHVMQADSLDEDKSGLVSMDEFCKLFEPTIVRRSSSAGTMDIDDLMKEVCILWACLDLLDCGWSLLSRGVAERRRCDLGKRIRP